MTKYQEKLRHENMIQYELGPDAMRKIKVCTHCGAKSSTKNHSCEQCGAKLPTESLYMFYIKNHFVCAKCKTAVSAKYNYCPQCGKQLIYQ